MNRMTETNKPNNTTASKSVQSGFMENLSDAIKCQYNKNSVSCIHSLYLTEIVQRLRVHTFLDNDKCFVMFHITSRRILNQTITI